MRSPATPAGGHTNRKAGGKGKKVGCGEKTAWETRHVVVKMEMERERDEERRSEGAREREKEQVSEGAR